MPTCNRRRFVPHAIDCFLRQDYAHLELLVADDGADAVEDLLPDDPRVRYLRMHPASRIGAKRNDACAAARGEIIVHWDDDDWSAPWRVSYQVQSLLDTDADICGLAHILFYDPNAGCAWEYLYPPVGRPWVHGATLAYRASFWRRNPFPDIHVGEDTRFVWSQQDPCVRPLERHDFFVGTIHGGNTSPKQTGDARWRSIPSEEIARTLGSEWDRYCRAMGASA
jgi:glycosyltransferase involved in cell wall biosynthesis